MRPLMLALGGTLFAGAPALIALGPVLLMIFALLVLAALVGSLFIGGLLRRIWAQYEQRAIETRWQERERLLDSGRSVVPWSKTREWRPRSASTRTVAQAETVARVLYIVARDQPDLFAFLRRDFAAEEAEGVIEILTDRRQGVQPCETEGRDPRRNWSVSVDLREIGFAFSRRALSQSSGSRRWIYSRVFSPRSSTR
jgi:hypothetical protein